MLPQPNRLPRIEHRSVLRHGRRIHYEDFTLIIRPNTLPVSRFAFQVGVKIDKKAVQRNRMKRLMREAVHHLLPETKPGFDCIFIAKQNFSEKKEIEMEKEIQNACNHLTDWILLRQLADQNDYTA